MRPSQAKPSAQARLRLVTATAAERVGELLRRRRARPAPPPPPLITQSSPGQIAELQQAYGADMAPSAAPPAAPEDGRTQRS